MKSMFYSVFNYFKRNKPGNPRSYTLRIAFDRYLSEISSEKRSGDQERSICKAWMATSLADMPLIRIRPHHLVKLRDEWLQTLRPATVVRRLALLSHLFNIAHKEWALESLRNPVSLIRKPKVNNARERRPLTNINIPGEPSDELAWLVASVRNPQFGSFVTLAVETAMRRSEIISLRWENIDFERKTAYLPVTKNGHPRTVPLSPVALNELRLLCRGSAEGSIFTVGASAITRMLVRARRRCRFRYEDLCQKHGVLPIKNAFRDLRVHDLRHEGISRLAPLFQAHELARISGHRDTRMLMRYFHPDVAQFAERLSAT